MARKGKYLDEEMLFQKGFMEPNREGVWRMKQMRDVMDERVKPERVPSNILHVFQVTTWDFGIESDILKGRRINFCFCIKQRNDGKINSHKWFFLALCKYLKPEFTLMLDIGTRPDEYAI
jgi:cellulose synthase/poly-beta-1,6-N-acetylglucosamine synthase-like glycosyltransferase